jgi:hypothetical protein
MIIVQLMAWVQDSLDVPDAAVGEYSPLGDVGVVFADHQACAAQSYVFAKAIGKSFIAILMTREREKISRAENKNID